MIQFTHEDGGIGFVAAARIVRIRERVIEFGAERPPGCLIRLDNGEEIMARESAPEIAERHQLETM